ncbi:hypothetical protein LX36DRAFT_487665 [Colletotrichum falcatum]|nr:hypothetical protein LX36DRAFT_487665 [Colletotrichum falcatum]
MLVLSTVSRLATSRAGIRTHHDSPCLSLPMRLLTRCGHIRTPEALGRAQRRGDRELHNVSRTSTTTRDSNEPSTENLTHAVKEPLPQLRGPEATSWGSSAGKPLTRRPTAGTQRAVNRQRDSKSPTEATRTPRPAPTSLSIGNWGSCFHQQVEGPAINPKAVDKMPRQRAVSARPTAPRWGLHHIKSEELAEKWGSAYFAQTTRAVVARHMRKPSAKPAVATIDHLLKPPSERPSAEAAAPLSSREPPQAPRCEKWEALQQHRGFTKDDGGKPEARKEPRQGEREKIDRHFRDGKRKRYQKFFDDRVSNDESLWAPKDYVYDGPFWMQLLLRKFDRGSLNQGTCCLCMQRTTGITGHHVIPKQVVRDYPGRFTRLQTIAVLPLCQPCHSVVHYVFPNERLAMKYHSIGPIISDPRIKSWLFFTQHYSVDDLRRLMPIPPKPLLYLPAPVFGDLRELIPITEAALQRIWTRYSSRERLSLGSNPRALRLAAIKHGAPPTVLQSHIQSIMQRRGEWAGWYYQVFEMGKRNQGKKNHFTPSNTIGYIL